jgi:D-beta-D-heptose 7-phosphate kinase/D-beta-D-heptose 1-phosphate adenosyltransferase
VLVLGDDDLTSVAIRLVAERLGRPAALRGLLVVDVDPDVVAGINRGESHIGDVASGELKKLVDDGRVAATADYDALGDADAIILEDYNKGVLVPSVIEQVTRWARDTGVPVVVDPKYRHFFAYRGATVFKPNRRELEAALGASVDLDHPEALPAIPRRLGVDHLLLTLGERGMVLFSSDGVVHRVPTTARQVYDVVGAGDTVTAYLATLLAAGATVREAAVVANFAAGVEVEKPGAATVSADEVLAAYDDFMERNPVPAPEHAKA